MVTYSSYLSKKESLIQPAVSIVTMNLLIALLAGLAIFPAVFSLGLEPTEGPGLLFVVLPAVFDQIVFGEVFLLAFLALFLFATLTSAFSMLEIIVASVVKGKVEKRTKYAFMVGALIFAVGVPSALSYSTFVDILIFSNNLFDSADYLVSNILMPLGVFLISIFVTNKIKRSTLREELLQHSRLGASVFQIWFFIMRFIIPLVIIVVFLNITGILDKIVKAF